MRDPNKPMVRFRHSQVSRLQAEVVPLRKVFVGAHQPESLSRDEAQKLLRIIATDTDKIVVVAHARLRQRQRRITRPQIERCIQKGVITEGPYINAHGSWQANVTRYAAGEEITCVVVIEWLTKIIVITAF